VTADRGWKRPFEEPIPLPRGRPLVTLEDAGAYITKLPKAEYTMAEWQAAMEALILVAASGGPTMFARIGIMRALNRRVERVQSRPQRQALGKAQVEEGSVKALSLSGFDRGGPATELLFLPMEPPFGFTSGALWP
jgi:hypothetical protein